MFILNRTFYYFDDIIKLEDFDTDNILINKKSLENILIYKISYKTLIDLKPLRNRFNKIDGFIRTYDEIRYLTLFGPQKYDVIYDRIRLKAKKFQSPILKVKKWRHIYLLKISLFFKNQS